MSNNSPSNIHHANIHHANYFVGNEASIQDIALWVKDKLKIKSEGNPDWFLKSFESFNIADANELRSRERIVPANPSGKKVFILEIIGITNEAQNALLKMLEEPSSGTYFFISIPNRDILLPTVCSRMNLVHLKPTKIKGAPITNTGKVTSKVTDEVGKFLKKNKAEQLEFVKKMAEDVNKDKISKKEILDFLGNLEEFLRIDLTAKDNNKNIKSLKAIELARKYIHDRAPSLKMLLEYVILSL